MCAVCQCVCLDRVCVHYDRTCGIKRELLLLYQSHVVFVLVVLFLFFTKRCRAERMNYPSHLFEFDGIKKRGENNRRKRTSCWQKIY